MTSEFGKSYDKSNLRNMHSVYSTIIIQDALNPELSWTHYRFLMKFSDEKRYYHFICCISNKSIFFLNDN